VHSLLIKDQVAGLMMANKLNAKNQLVNSVITTALGKRKTWPSCASRFLWFGKIWDNWMPSEDCGNSCKNCP